MGAKPLAWAITGAGHFLEEVFKLMLELSFGRRITCFVSSAAEEVIRIYGLWGERGEVSEAAATPRYSPTASMARAPRARQLRGEAPGQGPGGRPQKRREVPGNAWSDGAERPCRAQGRH